MISYPIFSVRGCLIPQWRGQKMLGKFRLAPRLTVPRIRSQPFSTTDKTSSVTAAARSLNQKKTRKKMRDQNTSQSAFKARWFGGFCVSTVRCMTQSLAGTRVETGLGLAGLCLCNKVAKATTQPRNPPNFTNLGLETRFIGRR